MSGWYKTCMLEPEPKSGLRSIVGLGNWIEIRLGLDQGSSLPVRHHYGRYIAGC